MAILILSLSLFLVSCGGLGLKSPAESELDAGMSLFNLGEYKAAAERFEKATKEDPNFANAYLYLGRSYLNMSDYSRAIGPLRTAYRLSPEEVKKQVLDLLLDALFGASKLEGNKDRLDPKSLDGLRIMQDLLGK